MYTSVKDFLTDWKFETENTENLFANLTDSSLNQRIYSEGRTLARLAHHLALTTAEMLNRMGGNLNQPENLHWFPNC